MYDDPRANYGQESFLLSNIEIIENSGRDDLRMEQIINRLMNQKAVRVLNEERSEEGLVKYILYEVSLPEKASEKLIFEELLFLILSYLDEVRDCSEFGENEDARSGVLMDVFFTKLLSAEMKNSVVSEFLNLSYSDFLMYLGNCEGIDEKIRKNFRSLGDIFSEYNCTIKQEILTLRKETHKYWRAVEPIREYVRDIERATQKLLMEMFWPILSSRNILHNASSMMEIWGRYYE